MYILSLLFPFLPFIYAIPVLWPPPTRLESNPIQFYDQIQTKIHPTPRIQSDGFIHINPVDIIPSLPYPLLSSNPAKPSNLIPALPDPYPADPYYTEPNTDPNPVPYSDSQPIPKVILHGQSFTMTG